MPDAIMSMVAAIFEFLLQYWSSTRCIQASYFFCEVSSSVFRSPEARHPLGDLFPVKCVKELSFFLSFHGQINSLTILYVRKREEP